jgi:hypothetical protein
LARFYIANFWIVALQVRDIASGVRQALDNPKGDRVCHESNDGDRVRVERHLLASAAIKLASTAKPLPPTRPALMHETTTCSKT